jgi:ParB-like chromosome segregation protein Spo0J
MQQEKATPTAAAVMQPGSEGEKPRNGPEDPETGPLTFLALLDADASRPGEASARSDDASSSASQPDQVRDGSGEDQNTIQVSTIGTVGGDGDSHDDRPDADDLTRQSVDPVVVVSAEEEVGAPAPAEPTAKLAPPESDGDEITGPKPSSGSVQITSTTRAVPRWFEVSGMRWVPIDTIDVSPYVTRLPPTRDSQRALVESIRADTRPLEPLTVLGKTGTADGESLLDGRRRLEVMRSEYGCTHVPVVDVYLSDPLAISLYVNAREETDYERSLYERMRRIALLRQMVGSRTTNRTLAGRCREKESTVAEFIQWDRALPSTVLKMAGVDPVDHADALRAITRDGFRRLRREQNVSERSKILKKLVFYPASGTVLTEEPEVSDRITASWVGDDLRVTIKGARAMRKPELTAVKKAIARRLQEGTDESSPPSGSHRKSARRSRKHTSNSQRRGLR